MRSKHSLKFIFVVIALTTLLMTSCKSAAETEVTPSPVEESTGGDNTQPTNIPRPRPTRPVATTQPTEIQNTPEPRPTLAPTVTPAATSTETVEEIQTPEPTPTPTEETEPETVALRLPVVPGIIKTDALALVPNVDPGPPLSVVVSANHELEGYLHRVSGIIHNDSDQTYTGLGVIATFFMKNGMRYGPVDANVKCLLLAPGATCPFIVEARSKNLAEVIIHVTGYDTPRTPLAPDYWGISYTVDTIGYAHITGTVHNQYTIPARHVTIVGSLVNAEGDIVSVNATILLDSLAPGESAPFEIHLKYAPFRSININTQAEP